MRNEFDLSGMNMLPPLPPPEGQEHAGGSLVDAPPTQSERRKPTSTSAGRWSEFNNFVDVALRDLGNTAAAVWFVLFRDARGGVARCSQKWIAERIGKSTRTVHDAVKELIAAGLVDKVRQGYVGGGTNVYRVRALPPDGD